MRQRPRRQLDDAPAWVKVRGHVVAVYEKSLIYQVPDGFLYRRVRLPLSAVDWRVRSGDNDIQVRGWLAQRENLQQLPGSESWGMAFAANGAIIPLR